MHRLIPVWLSLTFLACGAPEPEPSVDACAAAAAHLADCAGEFPAVDVPACDEAEAQALLALDCQALNGGLEEGKADGGGRVSRFACRMGYYAACPVPACEDDTAEAAPAEGAACAEWLRYDGCAECEYYRCREALQPCGSDGYLLGYAGKYCDRFARVTEPRVSPAANAWLKRVRRCLVEWVEANVPYDATCEDLGRQGTDSHTVCYVETGFCELSPFDWFGIVHSVDPGDIPLRVFLTTAHGCLGEWFGL